MRQLIMLLAIATLCACKSASTVPELQVQAIKDVPYTGAAKNIEQTLDIYLPQSTHTAMPVHVYVHGGAWTKGDKSSVSDEQVRAYTDRGIVLVSLNYRLGPDHKYPANSRDIVSASSWLRSNIGRYGGDPNNMVLSGHSAGAHLVALFAVGTRSAPSQASGHYYRSIFSVDTASFDLTMPSKEGPLSRFVNRQKQKTFGRKRSTLISASPVHQIERGQNYSKLYLYTTLERENAVQHAARFARELSKYNYTSTNRNIAKLSHKEMGQALFMPGHMIFNDVVSSLGAQRR